MNNLSKCYLAVMAASLVACTGTPAGSSSSEVGAVSSTAQLSSVAAVSSASSVSSAPAPVSSAAPMSSASSISSASNSANMKMVYAINVGGAEVAANGITYGGDRFALGGTVHVVTDDIGGTGDDAVYQSERYGQLKYEIPVTNASYSVKLNFAELYVSAAGARVFDVWVEGKKVMTDLDVFSEAGKLESYDVEFNDIVVSDNSLSIELTAKTENPTISGIAIFSATGEFVEPPEPPAPEPGTATDENTGAGCSVASLPDSGSLPNTTGLPDPFKKLDGTRISKKSEWTCRRQEIVRQAYKYIYGEKPAKPESVTGTVTNSAVTVNVKHQGKSATINASISLPSGGSAPYPAVISFDGSGVADQMKAQGVAVINFTTGSGFGGGSNTSFNDIYGGSASAGNLAKWAWGVSRIIDVLQSSSSVIDSSKLAVTGCSYAGKGAFVAGAFDQRISLTVPVESGIGGVPSYKLVPQIEPNPSGSGSGPEQPQHAINNGWLPSGSLVNNYNKLPVDTHEVIGLVAPRGLLVVGNTGGNGANYKNLDFKTEYATTVAGKEIFKALGAETNITYDSRSVSHCSYNTGTDTALRANIEKFLKGGSSTTGTFTTDWEGVRTAPDQWIDWTTPILAD